MNDYEKDKINFRFSGYQLPLIQLDATGPAYIQIPNVIRHPDFEHQPAFYQQPVLRSFSSSSKLYNPLRQ
jgi:hypothetical protein